VLVKWQLPAPNFHETNQKEGRSGTLKEIREDEKVYGRVSILFNYPVKKQRNGPGESRQLSAANWERANRERANREEPTGSEPTESEQTERSQLSAANWEPGLFIKY